MATKKLVILGSGGMARETAWVVEDINRQSAEWEILGFWQHDLSLAGSHIVNGYQVLDPNQINARGLYAIAAIGNPSARGRAVREAISTGFDFATLVHPSVQIDTLRTKLGKGSILCPGTVLTTNVTVGEHVIINVGCTISHDCNIEEFVTISPGCHLAGHTHVEKYAFLGIGSVTIENHRIGAQSVIGAGAVVINDIPPGKTAIGIPARYKP